MVLMDSQMKLRLDLLREKLGNSFLSLAVQAKRAIAKERKVPINEVYLHDVIDFLWKQAGN